MDVSQNLITAICQIARKYCDNLQNCTLSCNVYELYALRFARNDSPAKSCCRDRCALHDLRTRKSLYPDFHRSMNSWLPKCGMMSTLATLRALYNSRSNGTQGR